MRTSSIPVLAVLLAGACVSMAQAVPGTPEENGLTPKSSTLFINLPSLKNNGSTESLGLALGNGGNVMVGWEDDGDDLTDLEAVWTMLDSTGSFVTPETGQTSLLPEYAGQSITNRFLSYFRADGSATAGRTSWGPKIKADFFGDGFGMGATSFELGVDIAALASTQLDAGGGGDFPTVQLLTGNGTPVGIVSGMTDADAEPAGDVRIGDWDFLKSGNVVIVGESRQDADLVSRFGGADPNRHAAYRVVTPAGVEVKSYSLVSDSAAERVEMWHGVGVTENGFGVRFSQGNPGRATVRLFDNNGNPTSTNINLAEATGFPIAGLGGRGDGVGFHGNGKDAYVHVTAGQDTEGNPQVWVTVLNTNGTVRYSKPAITDIPLTNPSSVDAAIDPSGRVLVAFDDSGFTGQRIVMARILKANGDGETGTFWVSEVETPETMAAEEARGPRVAWRNGLIAITWESKNGPEVSLDTGLPVKTVALRLFGTFKPGSAEGAGLTRIVADRPLLIPDNNSLGNWEPNASVLGTSTFLIEGNTFALGSSTEQRYVVGLQPAQGGAMRLGEGFYADDGTPFQGKINLSRQNGNPGRVAGDKRPGAKNFVVGGEASPHMLAPFQSDSRWTLGFDRLSDGRYACVQGYSLDTTTLVQTPLHKVIDSANGRLTEGDPQGNNQISRFGGELAFLDNGNYVSLVQDNSKVRNPNGNAAVATIFAPNGTVVKESFIVDANDIWSNLAAFKGGFAVRVVDQIFFFNNSGEITGQVNQNTSGSSFSSGRGDGTRIFSHINSSYVYLAGKLTTGAIVRVAVWDARDRSFVTSLDISEPGFTGDADRVNGAVDALDRFTVAWVSKPAGYTREQVAARVLALNGATKKITPLTSSFFAFLNSSTNDTIRSLGMTVAMTTRQILVAAKGEINRDNHPEEGANTPTEVNFFTVLSHPNPQDDPTPAAGNSQLPGLSVSQSAGNVTVSWPTTFTGFTLQSTASLNSPVTWATVNGVANNSVTLTAGGIQYFRLIK